MALKTYKFRLYPTPRQKEKLTQWLSLCCELYNAALQERRDAWKLNRVNIGYPHQNKQLPEIKELRPELKDVNSHVLQDSLRRLDKAFNAFFRRVKNGQTPGFPRFKPVQKFQSFTAPSSRYKIRDGKLDLSRFGQIKLRQDCPIEGVMAGLTIRREIDQWFACITVKFDPRPLPETNKK